MKESAREFIPSGTNNPNSYQQQRPSDSLPETSDKTATAVSPFPSFLSFSLV